MKYTVKKMIIAVYATGCLYFPSDAQFETKLSEFKLKGAVNSVQNMEYQVIDNNYRNLKEERMVLLTFDRNGNKTEEKYLSPEKNITYSSVIKYATSGELLEETINFYGQGNDMKKTYLFDSNKITVNISYKGDDSGVKSYSEYVMNSDKTVSKRTDYQGNDKIMEIKYSYSNGRLLSETNQTSEATLRFKYEYNAKNELIKKTETAADGKAIYTVLYAYDGKGNMLSETSSYVGEDKLDITYKYVYDSKGNWTEKQEKMNSNLFSVTKRKITYF